MNEDSEIIGFVRAKMEEDAVPSAAVLEAIEQAAMRESFVRAAARRRNRWMRSALAAASLLLVCGLLAPRLTTDRTRTDDCMAQVIDLLSEEDEVEVARAAGDTDADLLLGWQDLPYEAVISAYAAPTESL